MEQFRAQISSFLDNLGRENVVRYTAWYMVGYIFLFICVGICGGVAGTIMAGSSAIAGAAAAESNFGATAEGREALEAMGQAGGLGLMFIISGVLSLLVAPLAIAAAVGLFQRKSWARMLTVYAAVAGALLSLIGFNWSSIFWVAADLLIAYVFYTDEGIRQVLSN